MRKSRLSNSDINSDMENVKRRIRGELERLINLVEFSPSPRSYKKKTLRDLSLALDTVMDIRSLEIQQEPEKPKESNPKSTKVNKAGRSND